MDWVYNRGIYQPWCMVRRKFDHFDNPMNASSIPWDVSSCCYPHTGSHEWWPKSYRSVDDYGKEDPSPQMAFMYVKSFQIIETFLNSAHCFSIHMLLPRGCDQKSWRWWQYPRFGIAISSLSTINSFSSFSIQSWIVLSRSIIQKCLPDSILMLPLMRSKMPRLVILGCMQSFIQLIGYVRGFILSQCQHPMARKSRSCLRNWRQHMALNVTFISAWNKWKYTIDTESDTHTLINIKTNEQKKDWYLQLNPNGMIKSRAVSSSKLIIVQVASQFWLITPRLLLLQLWRQVQNCSTS